MVLYTNNLIKGNSYMKSFQKHKNWILLTISAIIVFLFVFISNRISPFLIDNDNFLLKTLVSGEVTGRPEFQLYYIGIVFGSLVSSLYKLTGNGIPWFGIILMLALALVLISVMYYSVKQCQNTISAMFIWGISLLVVIAFFYRFFAETQYTIISGIVGCGAVFLFLLADSEDLRSNRLLIVLLFAFSLLSYSLRSKGFIMLFPFLGMIFVSKFCDILFFHQTEAHSSAGKRKSLVNLFALSLVLILSCFINFSTNLLGYSSDEWKEFDAYTDSRTVIYDYTGYPDYNENIDLYQAQGITESSYVAATSHYNLLLDQNINVDSMYSIATTAHNIRQASKLPFVAELKDLALKIIDRNLFDYTDRPINLLVFWMYFCLVIIGVLSRKYRMLLDILFIIIARMFDWIYLVYNGRYPFRVTQIIFIAELFCLIGIAINYKIWELPVISFKGKLLRPLTALMFLGIIGISIRFGIPVVKDVKYSTVAFGDLSTSFVELEEYLEDHPNNFYYLEMSNLHYREKTLDTRIRPYENYIYMGSWVVNSPWYKHKLERHGIENPAQAIINRDDIFIIYQVTDLYSRDYLDDLFEEHYPGTVVEKVDELVTSNGFVYEFLSVHK